MTTGIKAKDLRPCDNCGAPIAPFFYRLQIRFRQCFINPTAVRQVVGTAIVLGSITLGSMMSPDSDAVIESPSYIIDKDIWLCQECVMGAKGEPFTLTPVELMIESES